MTLHLTRMKQEIGRVSEVLARIIHGGVDFLEVSGD